jgi:protein-S-isoprenylcysteine O-methyltransferase Ste14
MTAGWVPPALGPRGEGWVALQFVVLGLALAAGVTGGAWPHEAATWLLVAGLALAVAGAALATAGIRHLGSSITPFPMPGEGAELREHGSYRLVRHPIYGGVLLASLGWALATSPLALVPAVILGLVFRGKSAREEMWLSERHEGYAAYRARVTKRFVPFVW